MYIKYQETNYPCECYPSNERMVYSGLPEDFPAPAVGEIALCANDGFVMRMDNPADYLRQTFEGGILTLTNQPEPVVPEPIPEPEPVLTVWEELDAAYQEGVNDV
jgi:hypothetical protein